MAQKKNNSKVMENEATTVEVVVATETKKETKKTEAKAKTSKKKEEAKKEATKTVKKEVKAEKPKKEVKKEVSKKEKDNVKAKKEVKKTNEKAKETKAKKEIKKVSEKPKKEVKETKETKKEATKIKGKKTPKVAKEKKEKKVVEVFKKPKDGSLAQMIINAANNKYPYRNDKGMTMLDAKTRKKLTDEEYAKLSLHRDICKELVRLSTQANNFPYSVLVYFAVGTDAHRPIAFNKGYKTINIPKAETILRWLKWFAEYNKNPRFYACDKIVHAFTKLYNEYSKKDKDFKSIMKQWTKMPLADGYKTTQFKTMKDFYQLLTKPLILTAKVDEKTGTETIVSITPNPLAEGNEPKEMPKEKQVASASCTTIVPYTHYKIG